MEYRYVVLNSAGQAAHAEDWSCPSDVHAVERALQTSAPYGAELWRGDQQLSVIPPRLTSAPS